MEYGLKVPILMFVLGIYNFVMLFFYLDYPLACLFFAMQFVCALILAIPGLSVLILVQCCRCAGNLSTKLDHFCDWWYQFIPIESYGVVICWTLQQAFLVTALVKNVNFFWDPLYKEWVRVFACIDLFLLSVNFVLYPYYRISWCFKRNQIRERVDSLLEFENAQEHLFEDDEFEGLEEITLKDASQTY